MRTLILIALTTGAAIAQTQGGDLKTALGTSVENGAAILSYTIW